MEFMEWILFYRTGLITVFRVVPTLEEPWEKSWLSRILCPTGVVSRDARCQIAKFMGPTWGPPGSSRPQMGPMLAPWTLLPGLYNCWRTPIQFSYQPCSVASEPLWELMLRLSPNLSQFVRFSERPIWESDLLVQEMDFLAIRLTVLQRDRTYMHQTGQVISESLSYLTLSWPYGWPPNPPGFRSPPLSVLHRYDQTPSVPR